MDNALRWLHASLWVFGLAALAVPLQNALHTGLWENVGIGILCGLISAKIVWDND